MKVIDMDIRDLRYFLKTAELQHVGKSAEELHITQPALSKAILRLEQFYETQLFERVGRGIRLTEAGELLYQRSLSIDYNLREIQQEIKAFGKGISGLVRIGTAASVATFIMPDVLRILQEKLPDVRLDLRVGMNDILRNALQKGEIDLAIGPLQGYETNLVSIPIFDDTAVVAARSGHPLAEKKDVSLENMSHFGWILSSRSVATRQWLENIFRSNNLPPPNVIVSTNLIASTPRILAETDLLSFMSILNITRNTRGEKLVQIKNPHTNMKRTFGIIHNANAFLSPASRALIRILENMSTL